jgi:hypothetical protein
MKSPPSKLLSQFDYYLIDKRRPLSMYTRKMDPDNEEIKPYIEIFSENESHVLYKIKKEFTPVLSEHFEKAHIVNVSEPEIKVFKKESSEYKIVLEIGNSIENSMGRFQINWSDENGNFLGTSLIPFELHLGRDTYTSPILQDIPKKATNGILYLTSHDNKKIMLYRYTLLQKNSRNFLDNALEKYNNKLPHLAR